MNEEKKTARPPIKGGWRGNLNGAVEDTKGTEIQVSEVTLRLDPYTAWALANQLTDRAIKEANAVDNEQVAVLSTFGAALGRLIDHPAANNGGRDLKLELAMVVGARRGKLLADIFNCDAAESLPIEIKQRIDAELMGYGAKASAS